MTKITRQPRPNWKKVIGGLILKYCDSKASRTFTRQEFIKRYKAELKKHNPQNHHIEEKISQAFQDLRRDSYLIFEKKRGNYTLSDKISLPRETEDFAGIQKFIDSLKNHPDEKEYFREVFARNRGVVREAKDKFGSMCMLVGCGLNFKKENGNNYVEVHHIKPLYEGGEDALWNLSVVCAHHHRMAHFAESRERNRIKKQLEQTNIEKMEALGLR